MSILQEYEQIKKKIGHKKYNAIDKYLNIMCPQSNIDKYNEECKKLIFTEWLEKEKELKQKYNIIYLSDILYNPIEWAKFEKWYELNK